MPPLQPREWDILGHKMYGSGPVRSGLWIEGICNPVSCQNMHALRSLVVTSSTGQVFTVKIPIEHAVFVCN